MRAAADGAASVSDPDGANRALSGTRDAEIAPAPAERAIRDVMWRQVGLFRNRDALQNALDALDAPWREVMRSIRSGASLAADEWKRANLLTVARLIARAALRREESRGAHYRDDYPRRDDIHWNKRITETIEQSIG